MKRSFKLLLVAGLILSMLPGFSLVYADRQFDGKDQGKTTVSWDLSGCWIDIVAHHSLDMGNYNNTAPGDKINSEGIPSGKKQVRVITNCPSDYSVSATATKFDLPDDHPDSPGTAIGDFAIKGGGISDYTAFSGLDEPITVLGASGPGGRVITMDYQYTIDANDVPGTYTVYLTYTASTS